MCQGYVDSATKVPIETANISQYCISMLQWLIYFSDSRQPQYSA